MPRRCSTSFWMVVAISGIGCSEQQEANTVSYPCKGVITDICEFDGAWIVAEMQVSHQRRRLRVLSGAKGSETELRIEAGSARTNGHSLYVATPNAILKFMSSESLLASSESERILLEGDGIPGIGPLHVTTKGGWILPQWVALEFGVMHRRPVWDVSESPALAELLSQFEQKHEASDVYSIAATDSPDPVIVASITDRSNWQTKVIVLKPTSENVILHPFRKPVNVAICNGGAFCAILSDNSVYLIDVTSGEVIWSYIQKLKLPTKRSIVRTRVRTLVDDAWSFLPTANASQWS